MPSVSRHLSWPQFKQDMLDPLVPALHLIPGEPALTLFVDGRGEALGARIPYQRGTDIPKVSASAISLRRVVVAGDIMLELRTEDEAVYAAFYELIIRIADLIQVEKVPARTAVERAVQELRQLLRQAASLTEAQVIGIWGELWCLKALIRARGAEVLRAWLGPDAESQDFRLADLALEVKTTSGAVRRHTINGLSQLASPPTLPLFLLSITVIRSGPGGGMTLAALAAAIDTLLASDARATFREKLNALRYDAESELITEYGFHLAAEPRLIAVDGAFPRLSRGVLEAVLGRDGAARIEDADYVLNCEGLGVEVNDGSLGKALLRELSHHDS